MIEDNQPGKAELLHLMRRRGEWLAATMAATFTARQRSGNAIGDWGTAALAIMGTAKAMMRREGFPQFAIDEYERAATAKCRELIAAVIGRRKAVKLFRDRGFTLGNA